MINFENIEEKLKKTCESKKWKKLIDTFASCKRVYLLGNGGLHFVAAHAATDCTRLIDDKVVLSFDSVGHITSNANDHGYENVFIKWLDKSIIKDEYKDTLVIGMSCSGNSKNVTRALSWSNSRGIKNFMISGRKSKRLESGLDELVLSCDYFHTVEVITLMLFYQVIHELGFECPSIIKEVERKDPWAI